MAGYCIEKGSDSVGEVLEHSLRLWKVDVIRLIDRTAHGCIGMLHSMIGNLVGCASDHEEFVHWEIDHFETRYTCLKSILE